MIDSGYSNNESKSYVLVDELHLIKKNLNTLAQLLQQRLTRLAQTSLPTSHDDLLLLYQEHKVRRIHYQLNLHRQYAHERSQSRIRKQLFKDRLSKINCIRKKNNRSSIRVKLVVMFWYEKDFPFYF